MNLREHRRTVRLEAYEIYTTAGLTPDYFFDMAGDADAVGLKKLARLLRDFARTQTAAERAERLLGDELSREEFIPPEDEVFDIESAALVARRQRLAKRKKRRRK